MPKVLVLDCWTNKALSVVRGLGLKNIEVHVVSHTRIGAALYSRFVAKRFILPDVKTNNKLFTKELLGLLEKEKYDCILPLEEASIKVLLENKEEIESHTSSPLATKKSFDLANDKWEVLKLAASLNIPMPESYAPETEEEINSCLGKLKYPVIIKPKTSSGSRGLKKVMNRKEFERNYPSIRKKYGFPIIQECIDQTGQGVGVGALAKNGKVIVSYSYKRLREFPVNGGPSTLRESTDDAEIRTYSAQLLEKLGWHGVAMVEFKRDPKSNIPKLMEINPRFWGSLELAQVSGINFPYLLFCLSQNTEVVQPEYRTGVRCRWLIPGDIAHFISNPRRFSLEPSFFNFFDENTFYDDFKSFDIKGSLAVVVCTALSVFNINTWLIGVFRK